MYTTAQKCGPLPRSVARVLGLQKSRILAQVTTGGHSDLLRRAKQDGAKQDDGNPHNFIFLVFCSAAESHCHSSARAFQSQYNSTRTSRTPLCDGQGRCFCMCVRVYAMIPVVLGSRNGQDNGRLKSVAIAGAGWHHGNTKQRSATLYNDSTGTTAVQQQQQQQQQQPQQWSSSSGTPAPARHALAIARCFRVCVRGDHQPGDAKL